MFRNMGYFSVTMLLLCWCSGCVVGVEAGLGLVTTALWVSWMDGGPASHQPPATSHQPATSHKPATSLVQP